MAKTITFQPLVEKFLLRNKLKCIFVNTLIAFGAKAKRKEILAMDKPSNVILSAFVWETTTNGRQYWDKMYIRALRYEKDSIILN